jgi:hypothetical protein
MGEMRNLYKILAGRPKGKIPQGRPRRVWKDNNRMILRVSGVGRCGLDAFGSGWGPMAVCCESGNEPSGSINSGKFFDQLSDY